MGDFETRSSKTTSKSDKYLQELEEYDENDKLLTTQQQNLEFEIELHTDIIKERDEKINKITHTIYTVNTMLKDLSEMVCEQSYMIDTMENNIDDSAVKSKKATLELAKSDKDGKSSKQRQCLIVLFVVLLLFIISVIGTGFYRHEPKS